MRALNGVVQNYAWGDSHAIPSLLGVASDGQPWAELWFGTHREGPAALADGTPLSHVSGELPYLLKLLAASKPLSLQTHPSADQAKAGFELERQSGVTIDDPTALYRDSNAKPELLCALSRFDALCGFRPLAETAVLLRDLGLNELATMLQTEGLQATVAALYTRVIDHHQLVADCRGQRSDSAKLVASLADRYPDDPSVAVTLLLNRVQLEPGQALFLAPGNLHAYLNGFGVEVMGASDNVIRGGLTNKVVDVPELLRILRFEVLADPVVIAHEASGGKWHYPTPSAPFDLWRFEVQGVMSHAADGRELLLCTEGDCGELARGEAAYLAPGERIDLTGHGTIFRVAERIKR